MTVIAAQSVLSALSAAATSVEYALSRLEITPATWNLSAASYSDVSPARLVVWTHTPEEGRRLADALGLEAGTPVKVRAKQGQAGYTREEWGGEIGSVQVQVCATDR